MKTIDLRSDTVTQPTPAMRVQHISPSDQWSPGGGQEVITQGARSRVYLDQRVDDSAVSTWDGSNSPVDSDGNGSLWVDGVQLTGGQQKAANQWVSADELWSYSVSSSGTLVISRIGSGESITVRNWKNAGGNLLGIDLGEAQPEEPNTRPVYRGDQRAPLTADGFSYDWNKTQWAADGTLLGGVVEVGFSDVIGANAPNGAVIYGLAGNDALSGGAGNAPLWKLAA